MGYNCNTEVDDVILNKINSNYSEAHAYISFSSDNSLVIKLKIDKSDKLPEQFASLVKKIYTECNLDDGSYKGVTFAIDGDDESNSSNLCRIGFIKTYGYIGDASYTAFKIIGGPAFERYEGKFDEIFKTDEFYSSQQWYN